MAGTVVKSLRVDAALWAQVEAAAERGGVKAGPWVVACIELALGVVDLDVPQPEARPAAKIPRPPAARPQREKVGVAKAVLAEAESKAAHLARPARATESGGYEVQVGPRVYAPGSRLKAPRRF